MKTAFGGRADLFSVRRLGNVQSERWEHTPPTHFGRDTAAKGFAFLAPWLIGFAITGFGVTSCAAAAPAPAFPLKISANQRYLVDQNDRPFLVVGDTPWSLVAQLDEPDIARYLDDRARHGFNAIIVNLIEHKFATRAPAKRDGIAPFLKPGDFTQPNPAYFDYAHRAVSAANERGITVWLCPAYLGWGGGDEGFFKEIKVAGPGALRGYGRFVGERFRDLPNIVWMMGGDYALPEAERWTGAELALGLRESGARQLITAHGGQTSAVDTFGNQPWLAIDTVYRYQADLWQPLQANRQRQPVRPFVLIESTYEGEHNAKPEQIRRQAWWAMLSGACGQFFGNNPLWHFDGPGLFPANVTWQEALDSTGSRDMARLGAFFAGRPWHELEPYLENNLMTSGRGDGAHYIAAARTPDGTLGVLYFPADGRAAREIILDLRSFPGPVTAQWFNPARVTPLISHGSVLPNRERQALQSPGDNGTGANDWVLVLETERSPAATGLARKPNFVIILADDLGYGDLGCYGHPTIRTPHLDRMAAEGMRFTDFYSVAEVCTPSRAALLTGRYPVRSGMAHDRYRVLRNRSTGHLPAYEITLAEALRSVGYATGMVGKWHLGVWSINSDGHPRRHGFDFFLGLPHSNDMDPTAAAPRGAPGRPDQDPLWWNAPLYRNEELVERPADQTRLTRRYTEEAQRFIRNQKGQPFFLYFAHTFPHVPLFASGRFRGQSRRGLYGDVVEEIDWSVGQILDTLRREGLAENTFVFFSSDNGPWLIMNQQGGSAGLLRGGKGSTWEGGMRVPGIAWWPGKIPAGVVNPNLACLLDLFPTALNLAGGKAPADRVIDGVNLTDTLLRGAHSPRHVLFYYRGTRLFAVRKDQWKAHLFTQRGYGQPNPEAHDPPLLFDLNADPGESFNVATNHPVLVADLLNEIETHRVTVKPVDSQLETVQPAPANP